MSGINYERCFYKPTSGYVVQASGYNGIELSVEFSGIVVGISLSRSNG
jgi:hypothetical protein